MNALLLILRVEVVLCAIFGLWSHDWSLIIAGGICAAIVNAPFFLRELREV